MTIERPNFWRVYVKSDTVDFATINGILPAEVYVGGAGDVTMLNTDGSSALFTAVPVGTFLPAGKRIMSTGTAGGPFTVGYRI
jgi:hypothetical protein